MFEALLLICSLSLPGACAEIGDTWGPYKTMTNCQIRARQMFRDWRGPTRAIHRWANMHRFPWLAGELQIGAYCRRAKESSA